VFRQGVAVNNNNVKEYDDAFAFHWPHDDINHPHELAGCMCRAKQEDSPLVYANLIAEGHLLPVLFVCFNHTVFTLIRL
jgi:hypothetical protein